MGARILLVFALVTAAGAASAETLKDVREIAAGDFLAPRISPDGDTILVTGGKHRGLRLLSTEGDEVRLLSEDPGAGVDARFLDDHRVLFTARRAGARRRIVAGLDGSVREATDADVREPVAVELADRIYVRRPSGDLAPVASGDRFFAPLASPDGDRVAFQGIATGIYIYDRESGELLHLGPGTEPAWSPDGARLVFERTEDDGHQIVGSELYLFDVGARQLSRLTRTPEHIERRPSFGPNGQMIAYDDDRGGIYLARIEEGN